MDRVVQDFPDMATPVMAKTQKTWKTLKMEDVAKRMGCKPALAAQRLVALGYTKTCSRCGGSGRYSWNAIDGDRCYGCGGAGKSVAAVTEGVLAEALERIAKGELAGYFAEHAARRSIKRAVDAAWKTYKEARICAAYSATPTPRKSSSDDPAAWTAFYASPVWHAQTMLNAIMARVSKAEFELRDRTAVERVAMIEEAHEMLRRADAAWVSGGFDARGATS